MPHNKSAVKRMKASERRRAANTARKSSIRTVSREISAAVAAGDKEKSEQRYRTYCSLLDKAVKRNVINANCASRCKSRAARRVASVT